MRDDPAAAVFRKIAGGWILPFLLSNKMPFVIL